MDEKIEYFVGIDLHKKFMHVAILDSKGEVLDDFRLDCDFDTIRKKFSNMPRNTKYVLESSSVWYGIYRLLTDELGLDVTLSHPYHTRLIAESKKKTDKIDAIILADMLRGGFIVECHVPDADVVQNRQLVRYRASLVKSRTSYKNMIHGILLQDNIKIDGISFSNPWIGKVRKLNDWRIDQNLGIIAYLDDCIASTNIRISNAIKDNDDAKLLLSIPGVGNLTALTLAAEIDEIDRFHSADKLVSYFGLVASVRRSAESVHHGKITKKGNSMVRHLIVEAILVHCNTMRRKKSSTPVSEFYNRLAKRCIMSKARVATGAKLLRIIYWMLKKRIDFDSCIKEGRKSTYREPKTHS